MANSATIVKGIKDTASNMSKKANDSVEIIKINSNISSLQKKNQEIFARIGEVVYEAHIKAEAAEIEQDLNEVKVNKEEIQALLERSANLRGFVICKNCGKECPEDDNFCGACATKLEKPEE